MLIAAGAALATTDVTEAPQPLSSFEIPPGFTKFDPRQLIEWLKHSDVWVEQSS